MSQHSYIPATPHGVCASCHEFKPLPYRRDDMGGYVCLTCVEKRLNALIEGIADARQETINLSHQIDKVNSAMTALQARLNELLPPYES